MDTVEVMRVIHNDGFGGKVCSVSAAQTLRWLG